MKMPDGTIAGSTGLGRRTQRRQRRGGAARSPRISRDLRCDSAAACGRHDASDRSCSPPDTRVQARFRAPSRLASRCQISRKLRTWRRLSRPTARAFQMIGRRKITDVSASGASRREADAEACERAALSAAQAVDEVTKENLRRLEATMSWLQNEVRRLPRAPQIAPVRGVPAVRAQPALPATSAFDAVIDRSSLHRTVQGMTVQSAAPLPIWLRENEAPIRLPPPRRDSGWLWQRLVKFFWALHGRRAARLCVRHHDITASQAPRRHCRAYVDDLVVAPDVRRTGRAIARPRPDCNRAECRGGTERDAGSGVRSRCVSCGRGGDYA